MEISIQEAARLSGVSSRTLRHYDSLGLVPASRIASNGYRHYDEGALARLQRVLLLRDLGLSLAEIKRVLDQEVPEPAALQTHLELLREQRHQIEKQIAAVQHTLAAAHGKETLVADKMFDGFDHTKHKEEVEERWGRAAYQQSDRWWRGMSDQDRADWKQQLSQLGQDWLAVIADPQVEPSSAKAQAVAARHVDWLRGIPGTPAADPEGDLRGYVLALGDMYVADVRFAANYGGVEGATFVRDALAAYMDQEL